MSSHEEILVLYAGSGLYCSLSNEVLLLVASTNFGILEGSCAATRKIEEK